MAGADGSMVSRDLLLTPKKGTVVPGVTPPETPAKAATEKEVTKQEDETNAEEEKEEEFTAPDFTMEFKYSIWSDLCGEQTEFQDAFEQLSYHQFLKINIFNLFDYSTVGHEMIQLQRQNFAKYVV